ncbi:MAG TPA: ECF-type sigma factor [Gemmataceae bacterium]|nr:ECF-type sigma factor [Gemmataceae bacterium]
MSEVTRILSAIEQGDPQAAAQLLPLVDEELRKLAAQKLALVSESRLCVNGRFKTGHLWALQNQPG